MCLLPTRGNADLYRFAGPFAAATLLLAAPLPAGSWFGQADVFNINCRGTRVAQLVPVQPYGSVLVTYPQQFRFATLDFHATKANMLANWSTIAEQIRLQGIAHGCRPDDFTFASDTYSYMVVGEVRDKLRPSDVSLAVDVASVDRRYPFTHRDMEFAAARAQAFVIVAEDARIYDAGFGGRKVIGAVVFVLNGSHLLSATGDVPYLCAWNGRQYAFWKQLTYVTRENLMTASIQALLRDELETNRRGTPSIPAPTATAASTPAQRTTGTSADVAYAARVSINPPRSASVATYDASTRETRAEPDLAAYTTPELKYDLSHAEAAALLARYPSACGGVFTDIRPQGWFDEGFDPSLAGVFCDSADARRVWRWVPETGGKYRMGGIIPIGTEERSATGLLRRALGFSLDGQFNLRTGILDKAVLAAQEARVLRAKEARKRRLFDGFKTFGRRAVWALAAASSIVLLVVIPSAVAQLRRQNVRRVRVAQKRSVLKRVQELRRTAEANAAQAIAFDEEITRQLDKLLEEARR